MRKTITASLIAIALTLLGSPVSAQDAASTLPLLESNGTAYLSGGIGDEELQEIKQASKNFRLKLVLSEQSGAYLTDVEISISDAKGKTVLFVASAGPLLLAQLPPGAYLVSATYEGKELKKRITLRPDGLQTLAFAW